MAKKWKKVAAAATALVMASSIAVGLTACDNDKPDDNHSGVKTATLNTYTSQTPSMWNMLTYKEASATDIADYLESSFFTYDYKFDEALGGKFRSDGTVNAEAIVSGENEFAYEAATKLEDVTAEYAAKWGFTDKQVADGGYAWKITLREDLKWDDGTPIDSSDFIYSMKEQLNPLFKNFRANSYYNSKKIINAKKYVFQGESWMDARSVFDTYSEDIDSKLVFAVTKEYNAAVGSFTSIVGQYNYTPEFYLEAGLGLDVSKVVLLEGKTLAEIKADASLKATWDELITAWKSEPNEELDFFVALTVLDAVDFDKVGMDAPSKYEIVVGYENPINNLVDENGDLTVWAPYYFQSLPLVKKDLYESCKVEPQLGSTLWTSTYATSVATSASWGPYKLVEFQAGKAYKFVKNENWFGYGMEDYKNQYNVHTITCQVLENASTQWDAFLSGIVDSVGIDADHKDDYRNSKYAVFTPTDRTFALNVQGNLVNLKNSGRNNGILAIDDFRKAFSLGISRSEWNATISTSNLPAFGLFNSMYYYDIENGGVYRYTTEAKEALLRVYGFTKEADGTWTNGGLIKGYTLDEAYEAMNGYDPEQAKELVKSAYQTLIADPEKYGYDASKKITIEFGSYADNTDTRKQHEYLKSAIMSLIKDTPLEGKVEFTFSAASGDDVIDKFGGGAHDVIFTGWNGGVFDPAGIIDFLLDPAQATTNFWDTKTEMLTLTMPEGDYDGAGETLTMSIYNWAKCAIGSADGLAYNYDWSNGSVPHSVRLFVVSSLEEVALNHYYMIPVTSVYGASLLGAKFNNISDEYNYFMAYGGIRYRVVNYTDAEWTQFVANNNNNLTNEYKKTAD